MTAFAKNISTLFFDGMVFGYCILPMKSLLSISFIADYFFTDTEKVQVLVNQNSSQYCQPKFFENSNTRFFNSLVTQYCTDVGSIYFD
jgi:hypothetical protein